MLPLVQESLWWSPLVLRAGTTQVSVSAILSWILLNIWSERKSLSNITMKNNPSEIPLLYRIQPKKKRQFSIIRRFSVPGGKQALQWFLWLVRRDRWTPWRHLETRDKDRVRLEQEMLTHKHSQGAALVIFEAIYPRSCRAAGEALFPPPPVGAFSDFWKDPDSVCQYSTSNCRLVCQRLPAERLPCQ